MLQQALRFLVTGGINTAFGYAIYAACIFLGAGYAVASGVSIVNGLIAGAAGGVFSSGMTSDSVNKVAFFAHYDNCLLYGGRGD